MKGLYIWVTPGVASALKLIGDESGESAAQVGGKIVATSLRRAQALDRDDHSLYPNAQIQRLLTANKMLRHALEAASHDGRNIAQGILGLAELCLSHPDLPAEVRDELNLIVTATQMLRPLLSDIMVLCRHEAGESIKLNRRPVQLDKMIRQIVAMFQPIVRPGVSVQVECAALTIMADSTRLFQVLSNLFLNAIRFTAQGQITIRADLAESHLTVCVADTGPGIPAGQLDRVFDEFYKSDRSDGNGLGLFIVRQLVELMDGRVWVKSQFGAGSQFHFSIPAKGVDFEE